MKKQHYHGFRRHEHKEPLEYIMGSGCRIFVAVIFGCVLLFMILVSGG